MISFKDRVSAYPNRYTMVAENGTTSYVVLERADEPIVVGTPLNAATFNQLLEDLSLSGFGYGEPLTQIGVSSGETYADYCAKIDAVLATMENNTTKQVSVAPPPSEDSSFGACAVTLYKGSNAYASLTTLGHSNRYAYGWRMQKRSGAWEPFEWIDPPLTAGVVYRTTKRHKGNAIYEKLESSGVLYWSTDQTTWRTYSNMLGITYGDSEPSGGASGDIYFQII